MGFPVLWEIRDPQGHRDLMVLLDILGHQENVYLGEKENLVFLGDLEILVRSYSYLPASLSLFHSISASFSVRFLI